MTVSPAFADSFIFIALWCNDDQYHAEAKRLMSTLARPIVTTQWVLAETGNTLGKTKQRALFKPFVKDLEVSSLVRIIPADDESFNEALDLFAKRPDKEWSFVDCTSFVAMQRLGLTDALTGDHHFEQAGFHALLR